MTPRALEFMLGAAAVLLAVALVGFISWSNAQEEFGAEAMALHRAASQYADQHDAHLITLSAIAASDAAGRLELFAEVARSILRYDPRVVAIDLVPLQAFGAGVTTRSAAPQTLAATLAAAAPPAGAGPAIVAVDDVAGHYRLLQRSVDGGHAVSLELDAAAMLVSDRAFWSRPNVQRALVMPSGSILAGSVGPDGPGFAEALGSASQPLMLQASMTASPMDVLPPWPTLAAVLGALAASGVVLWGLRQLAGARRAEARALLSDHRARLAHAARVNGLGEMASGIAHEITQPLTAILSQAQASRRLAERGDLAALVPVLDDTILQTKRASAILQRLRDWVRPRETPAGPMAVETAARNVEALLSALAGQKSCRLMLSLSDRPLLVRADPVELEQVVFNLLNNAIEALQPGGGLIEIVTRRDGSHAVVEVVDDGPGVAAPLRDTLFEPFVTGRPDGMGLGLALCRRLVERMDGDLTLVPSRTGATFRVRLPLMEMTP